MKEGVNICADRKKPGLMRQHLTALKAASAVCNAETDGVLMPSTKVTFISGTICPGKCRFASGTADITILILRIFLPALPSGKGAPEVVLEGRTHNSMAPPFNFLKHAFIPLLEKMDARFRKG